MGLLPRHRHSVVIDHKDIKDSTEKQMKKFFQQQCKMMKEYDVLKASAR